MSNAKGRLASAVRNLENALTFAQSLEFGLRDK